jgi:hypothetical protein
MRPSVGIASSMARLVEMTWVRSITRTNFWTNEEKTAQLACIDQCEHTLSRACDEKRQAHNDDIAAYLEGTQHSSELAAILTNGQTYKIATEDCKHIWKMTAGVYTVTNVADGAIEQLRIEETTVNHHIIDAIDWISSGVGQLNKQIMSSRSTFMSLASWRRDVDKTIPFAEQHRAVPLARHTAILNRKKLAETYRMVSGLRWNFKSADAHFNGTQNDCDISKAEALQYLAQQSERVSALLERLCAMAKQRQMVFPLYARTRYSLQCDIVLQSIEHERTIVPRAAIVHVHSTHGD